MRKIAFVALALLISGSAFAQTKKPGLAVTGNIVADVKTDLANLGLTGNPSKDSTIIWNKIAAASIADLTYASAMAVAANTSASAVRNQCWQAIIAANKQASGQLLKNADGTPMVKPDPHVYSDVESLAETIDNLSPQGPLFTNCAGAAQLAKTNTLALINALVTGAAAFTATGGIIP